MRLTDKLRKDAEPIWMKIFNHPFVIELYSGTLPIEKFKYYVIQDYNYLITMYKCLSLLSARSEYDIAKVTLELAYLDATVEIENYNRLLKELNISFEEVRKTEPSPTNMAYMNFLLSICALKPVIEGLTAILPCFWSYHDIARYHSSRLKVNSNKLYREWGEVYLSKDYIKIVDMLRELVDKYGLEYDYNILKNIFVRGSIYEYMYWDMAYKMERWPL